jgi:HEPN domain-containing protein
MRRLTRAWVKKAEEDVLAAQVIHTQGLEARDAICFHAQQAAEKYLEALMQEQKIPFPKTHDLLQLLNLLLPTHTNLGSYRRGLKMLSRYAVDSRYPGFMANARQASASIRWMQRIRQDIRQCLGLPSP